VDLQASKKSKGLQEQQSPHNSNMLARYCLTISNRGVSIAGFSLWELVSAGKKIPSLKPALLPGYGFICNKKGEGGTSNCGVNRQKRTRTHSIHRRKDPIKRQNPQQPGLRNFPVPAASRVLAGNFHLAEDFHGVVFRERGFGALPLQIDIVPVLRARKHNSVSFTHNS
jgi:hypothetical protein